METYVTLGIGVAIGFGLSYAVTWIYNEYKTLSASLVTTVETDVTKVETGVKAIV